MTASEMPGEPGLKWGWGGGEENFCCWLKDRDVGAYGRMKTREDKIPGYSQFYNLARS